MEVPLLSVKVANRPGEGQNPENEPFGQSGTRCSVFNPDTEEPYGVTEEEDPNKPEVRYVRFSCSSHPLGRLFFPSSVVQYAIESSRTCCLSTRLDFFQSERVSGLNGRWKLNVRLLCFHAQVSQFKCQISGPQEGGLGCAGLVDESTWKSPGDRNGVDAERQRRDGGG